ncbi:MAG: hypothetical protein N2Z22_08365 [Turneriella sp.]|nr:hypothetical protein [Turneriella sp.]
MLGLLSALLAVIFCGALAAAPFSWEPRGEEPGFTIDVPNNWQQLARARDKVAQVHFEKRDRAGRVAIEVRAYSSDNTEPDHLLLQLRSRLAVRYDRLFLKKRKEIQFRKDTEQQIWTAWQGDKKYTLLTTTIADDDNVLQLVCVAPAKRYAVYSYIFDNALLSLDFAGKSAEGGQAAKTEPEKTQAEIATPTPAPQPAQQTTPPAKSPAPATPASPAKSTK